MPRTFDFRSLLALAMMSVLVGCASNKPLSSVVPEAEREIFSTQDISEIGIAVVLVEGDSEYPETIWINDKKLATAIGGIVRMPLLPGNYTLKHQAEDDVEPGTVDFSLGAGQIRYFIDDESWIWDSD